MKTATCLSYFGSDSHVAAAPSRGCGAQRLAACFSRRMGITNHPFQRLETEARSDAEEKHARRVSDVRGDFVNQRRLPRVVPFRDGLDKCVGDSSSWLPDENRSPRTNLPRLTK